MKVIPIASEKYVKDCAYYQNNLAQRKKACDYCDSYWDCNQMDADRMKARVEALLK